MSYVRTTAELALRNRQMDAASRRAFEEIVAECGKANRLLKDMLTLARADAGNSRLAFEPVDLVEVVRAVCQKARLFAEEHGHTLTARLRRVVTRLSGAITPVFTGYCGSCWITLRSIRGLPAQ